MTYMPVAMKNPIIPSEQYVHNMTNGLMFMESKTCRHNSKSFDTLITNNANGR